MTKMNRFILIFLTVLSTYGCHWNTHAAKIGDTRVVQGFAFLPSDLNDGTTVWLEFYTVYETYTARNILSGPEWIRQYTERNP